MQLSTVMASGTGKEIACGLSDDEQFVVVRRGRKKSWRRSRGRDGKIAAAVCYPRDEIPIEKIDTVIKNASDNTELIKYR